MAPGLHCRQIVVLAGWHSTQRSSSHLKQAPEAAVKEKGLLQVVQELVLALRHVAQGYWHSTQAPATNEVGGTHLVQVVAEDEQVAQGGVHLWQAPADRKNPS